MTDEPKKLFTVVRDADGTISVDWELEMYPLLADDGKTTDRVIALAEKILSGNDDSDEDDGDPRTPEFGVAF